MIRYSIVIPAHNEERYIKKTLEKATKLKHESYEVIVVENGSNDNTYAVAKRYASRTVKVYSLRKGGVSRAKNYGAKKAAKSAEWIIFLDADTLLEKKFLEELDIFLGKDKRLAIGTTRVRPAENSTYMALWFRTYDLVHKISRSSCSIQIAKREYFDKIKYDETLTIGEDIKLIRNMHRYGRFFYVDTKTVSTSTRRFEREGPLKLTVQWLIAALVPYSFREKLGYKVIR